jgi:SAM-dependent methyltransferase
MSVTERRDHWQAVYETKPADAVSWYRPHLEQSLAFVRASGVDVTGCIVDVGGGASTLVDDLLDAGYRDVAVIDLAAAALDVAKARLGGRAAEVRWVVGDVTTPLLPANSVDFWHDRAVFHFLTDEGSRAAYLAQVLRAVKPGGHVLVATFGLDGPERCSGLPVARYDAEGIHAVFGDTFHKIGQAAERHETPWGSAQSFVYCFCRRA